MSAQKVQIDQVRIAGRDLFQDLNTVRTHVRQELYGRSAPAGAIVDVILPSGEVEVWEFDEHIGYPTNSKRNWMEDWQNDYT